MKLDLRKIIDMPGAELPFEFGLEEDGLDFPSVISYTENPVVRGRVYNEAGVLHLTGSITADMLCKCDRCGKEFESIKLTDVDAVLAEENPDDDPWLFVFEGNAADIGEIMKTCLILDMESKFLCSEDCKGLCPSCGKNLNHGPCGCRKEIDPRFAVLSSLLDK